jgi:nitrate reductase alpha subunit
MTSARTSPFARTVAIRGAESITAVADAVARPAYRQQLLVCTFDHTHLACHNDEHLVPFLALTAQRLTVISTSSWAMSAIC